MSHPWKRPSLAIVVFSLFLCVRVAVPVWGDYFPPPESKGGWRKLESLREVRLASGMDPRKLGELRQWLLDSDQRDFAAVIVRRGHIVLEVERGNSAKSDSRRVASVSKAICATVLAIASEQSQQGETPKEMTFDDQAFDFIPWAKPLSDPRKANIKIKQLLNHTSGITPESTGARNRGPWEHVLGHDGDPLTEKLAFAPGTKCGYSTFALYHASLVCEDVTGQPYDQFAIEALFKPIGVEHWWFQQFDGGDKYGQHPSHAMGMPARDLARIAYCMMRGGQWRDRQVIPQWFVNETSRATHDVQTPELRFDRAAQSFSHGWELPAQLAGSDGKGFPKDARYKPGSGGQLIAFVPSLDLVVTRQTGGSGAWEYEEYLRRACAAVLPEFGADDDESEESFQGETRTGASSRPNTETSEQYHKRKLTFASDSNSEDLATNRDATSNHPKWSSIELEFAGPMSRASGDPNPFDIQFDVMFSGPHGRRFVVPGFYAGDGQGGPNGNVWKVRFSADETGAWGYQTRSDNRQLDSQSGRFRVIGIPASASGFWKLGRLEHPGTSTNGLRYLKFRDGPFWLKAGCDDPENFLGAYENYDTMRERRAAVDYLARHGINCQYIMTHNVDGDDNDVWPWLGSNPREAKANSLKHTRFDIAKLAQWRNLFTHMQSKGVVPYLILEDDSAWSEYDHARYYREVIARFGDLPALVFNLGEEHNENYSLARGLELARLFKNIDPYGHPLAIHNVNRANDQYVDSPYVDLTAIQTGQPGRPSAVKFAVEHNQMAVDWINRCRERGRRILVANFDEGRPEHDRRAWWSAYLGGGVWEAHVVEPYDQPMSAWETTWRELGGARRFMESLPFWDMQPRNDLITSGHAFCLAKPAEVYAVYMPRGGRFTIDLATSAAYQAQWWDPANSNDGDFQDAFEIQGGIQSFKSPTEDDWAIRLVRLAVEEDRPTR